LAVQPCVPGVFRSSLFLEGCVRFLSIPYCYPELDEWGKKSKRVARIFHFVRLGWFL